MVRQLRAGGGDLERVGALQGHGGDRVLQPVLVPQAAGDVAEEGALELPAHGGRQRVGGCSGGCMASFVHQSKHQGPIFEGSSKTI